VRVMAIKRFNREDILNFVRPEKRKVVARLAELKPTGISFNDSIFRVLYDGKVLRDKVIIKPHYAWVGGWSRKNPVIYIDDDILASPDHKELLSLLLHEAVERHVATTYDLHEYDEAHIVAESVEFNWAVNHGVSYHDYDILTDLIRKKESNEP